jgi:hypothetical protein
MDGICTLGNDRVYDQIIALLNSIEVMMGDIPVCIYPYDDNTAKLAEEVATRPNVQLYNHTDSIAKWDRFVRQVWDLHPTAKDRWQAAESTGYHRVGTHRRYGAFDGPFDRYLYMDADTLLMSPVHHIFDLLDFHDCIVYDFQYKDPTHVYEVNSPKLERVFPTERVEREIFCSGFYASKKNLFLDTDLEALLSYLKAGEAEILYPMAPDQTLVNYMMMRSGKSVYNLAFNLPQNQKTGCCITSTHFQEQDHILYDKDRRLTYLHYIGLSSSIIARVCQGENLDFPYRDLFLYYRYLHEPEKRPKFTGKLKLYNDTPSYLNRVLRTLGIK